MRDAMKADKARSTVGRISPNGLLEIQPSARQTGSRAATHRPCPTCTGTGTIPSPEFVQPEAPAEHRGASGGRPSQGRPRRAPPGARGRPPERAPVRRLPLSSASSTSRSRSTRPPASTGRRRGWKWIVREVAPASPRPAAVSAADLATGGRRPGRNRRREEAQATPRRPAASENRGMRPLLPRRRPKQVTRHDSSHPTRPRSGRQETQTRSPSARPRRRSDAAAGAGIGNRGDEAAPPETSAETGDEARLEPPVETRSGRQETQTRSPFGTAGKKKRRRGGRRHRKSGAEGPPAGDAGGELQASSELVSAPL